MKQGFIKVAASAIDVRVADVEHNVTSISNRLTDAKNAGVNLLVLPELSITSASCADLFFQASLLDAAKNALFSLAKATVGSDMILIVGLPLRYKGSVYNTAAVLQNGQVLGIIPKRTIDSNARQFSSDAGISRGEMITLNDSKIPFGQDLIFESDHVSFAVSIGNDIIAPFSMAEQATADGAMLLLNPTACPAYMEGGKQRCRDLLSVSSRLHCGCVSASCSYTESTQDLVMADHHFITENGKLLAEHSAFTPTTLLVSEIDTELLSAERQKNPSPTFCDLRHIRFYQEERTTVLTRSFDRNPFLPDDISPSDYAERGLTIQAYALRRRMEHTQSKTAVIGISGGLDSTLALLATVRAFDLMQKPRTDICAVTLPCFGTTDRTKQNAIHLCQELGVSFTEIQIKDSVLQHFHDIGHDPAIMDVTYENSQARERTQVLMDLANRMGGLVIGTGDMSELALGWATYNGDHMSMYGLNASIPKTLVRTLVAYEAKRLGDNICHILTDILDTPVSPELLPANDNGTIAQKTEDTIGPYELHDFFLYYFLCYGFSPSKIYRLAVYVFKNSYHEDIILKWFKIFVRRFFVSQFKRSCLPDGPKISSLSLSPRGDWHMPSDASYALYLKEIDQLFNR